MVDELMGEYGSRFLIAAAAVAVALLCLAAVLWIMKNRSSSPFIRGGKNRQPRLAVLDAAAVDARRRLVLVRRDDVEHLIMIGGPTDIVIESRIGQTIQAQPIPEQSVQPAATSVMTPDARQPESRKPENRQQDVRQADKRGQEIVPPDVRISEQNPIQTSTSLRTEARPEPKTSQPLGRPASGQPISSQQVSGMGHVLYSEADEEPLRQQRAADAKLSAERVAVPSAQSREPLNMQRPATVQQAIATPAERPPTPRALDTNPLTQPVTRHVSAVSTAGPDMTPSLNAEDILDAARLRVLPQQRNITAEAAPANVKDERKPDPSSNAAADFERILDAEISGDLQRLAPQRHFAPPNVQPRPGERQEPSMTVPMTGARSEPTIEQEMARMLAEMSVSRKN